MSGTTAMRYNDQRGEPHRAGGRLERTGRPQQAEQPPGAQAEQAPPAATEVTSEPSRLLRIVGMARYLMREVRDLDMDEASRGRLHDLYEQASRELCEVLSPTLREEFARLRPKFEDDPPSQNELQIAQAQLIGWLEGVFQGVRVALSLQQTSAGQDLASLRTARGVPMLAAVAPEQMPGPGQESPEERRRGAGPYL